VGAVEWKSLPTKNKGKGSTEGKEPKIAVLACHERGKSHADLEGSGGYVPGQGPKKDLRNLEIIAKGN